MSFSFIEGILKDVNNERRKEDAEVINKDSGIDAVSTLAGEEEKEMKFIRPDTHEIASVLWNWKASLKTTENNPGLTLNDYRTEFQIANVVIFEEIRGMLREDKFTEKNSRLLIKNIVMDEEINIDMLNKRYLMTDRALKWIGMCICLKCSITREDGKLAFRLLDSMYELKDHAKRIHNRIIQSSRIINADFKEAGKIHEIKTGAWRQHWLCSDKMKGDIVISLNDKSKNKKEKAQPNMDEVELVDKSEVRHKEKKNSFNFIIDPIELNKKDDLQKIFSFLPNKEQDIRNRSGPLALKYTNHFKNLLELCKEKYEHNNVDNDELLVFKNHCLKT